MLAVCSGCTLSTSEDPTAVRPVAVPDFEAVSGRAVAVGRALGKVAAIDRSRRRSWSRSKKCHREHCDARSADANLAQQAAPTTTRHLLRRCEVLGSLKNRHMFLLLVDSTARRIVSPGRTSTRVGTVERGQELTMRRYDESIGYSSTFDKQK